MFFVFYATNLQIKIYICVRIQLISCFNLKFKLISSNEKLLKSWNFHGSPDVEMDILDKNHNANSSNCFIRTLMKTKILNKPFILAGIDQCPQKVVFRNTVQRDNPKLLNLLFVLKVSA